MTETLRNACKVAGINLLVFFVVTNVIYWSIPTVANILELYGSVWKSTTSAVLSPSYSKQDTRWLATYEREYRQLQPVYRSFIGWRNNAFVGETINVEGPYLQRRTVNAAKPGAKTVYFFGGSTMWGVSSNDGGTIPSVFTSLTGLHAENFGNQGWVAHQGLMMLMQLIEDGHRPDFVIFYDGINEVYFKCLKDHGPVSHAMETRINKVLQQNMNPASFTAFFAPAWEVRNRLVSKLMLEIGADTATSRDCSENAEKSEQIAENLIRDWRLAKRLVESYGGKFVALLQPVLPFSRTPRNYLTGESFRRELRAVQTHFETVYPLLRKKVAESQGFYDVVEILDGDEPVYTDVFHISPKGNRRVAEKIKEIMISLGWVS